MVCAFPGAHRRGATVVQFSPTYGALLLSAGLDGSAHVRVTETGDIARSYSHGHDGGIRDARFDAAGGRFATGGFDGRVVVRDVETGDVTYRRKLGGVVYCVRWGGNEGGFIAGCGDRQVVQVDLRVKDGGVVQRYGEHMGSVLSLCFIDQGRRFVTSAEDKVLRVWEFGVPVVIKYVSEAGMHCIPMLKMHPNGKWVAGISADNCVRVFSCRDRFKKWDGKRFGGGIWGGYSGGLGFAPDGRLLGAGDSLGRLLIWDWRNCSNVAAIQAHDGVVMGFDWHPTSPSLIASCGWDGAVKMWH